MPADFLGSPARIEQFDPDRPLSNFLHMIWLGRPDLQAAFDIAKDDGQRAFLSWAEGSIEREYGIDLKSAFTRLEAPRPMGLFDRFKSHFLPDSAVAAAAPGANLIGYPKGVLGMGEHIRMTAETLARTTTDFGILDVEPAPDRTHLHGGSDFQALSEPRYRANIFHVNADQMLNTFCKLGADFLKHRYNIGFWAWELAKCPAAWVPVTQMVDEIWAPSRFIQDAFAAATDKPVVFMPLCVELPEIQPRCRSHFALPEGHCLFLYTFDFHSYIDRKNPFAAIRAFKQAFPDRRSEVGLVLKIMKGDPESAKWQEMLNLIDGDPRIHVINDVMSRNDVLALLDCCDCFVSLHRSEGFGRGPAEAMYLGKPVIVTNYSGNLDFTRPGASLLVDHTLIPVEPGQYVFGEGQVWADVDVSHAARQMRKVFESSPEVSEVAANGSQVIREEFSYAAIAQRMNDRLRTIGAI